MVKIEYKQPLKSIPIDSFLEINEYLHQNDEQKVATSKCCLMTPHYAISVVK
jgi:hypothetical protein